jgi:hypothetical protein
MQCNAFAHSPRFESTAGWCFRSTCTRSGRCLKATMTSRVGGARSRTSSRVGLTLSRACPAAARPKVAGDMAAPLLGARHPRRQRFRRPPGLRPLQPCDARLSLAPGRLALLVVPRLCRARLLPVGLDRPRRRWGRSRRACRGIEQGALWWPTNWRCREVGGTPKRVPPYASVSCPLQLTL